MDQDQPKLAFYKGTSLVSKLIRWQTRGVYSHVAFWMPDGSCMEAREFGGVRHVANLSVRHTPGTEVDIYSFPKLSPEKVEHLNQFLISQLGCGYDYRSVLRFISRRDAGSKDKWFCAEWVAAAIQGEGVDLLSRIHAWAISPAMLSYSPLLDLETSLITT